MKYLKFIAKNLTEPDAFQLEMFLIHLYGRIDNGTGILRNRTDGGEGPSGAVVSKETREKLRSLFKGKPRPEWVKEKLRKPKTPEGRAKMKGRVFSEEHKEKISLSRKRVIITEETRNKHRQRMTGLKLSEETRNKISESNRRRTLSPESKRKIAESVRKYFEQKHAKQQSEIGSLFP